MGDSVFIRRHIGPSAAEQRQMLDALGLESLEALTDETVPQSLMRRDAAGLPAPLSEGEMLDLLRGIAAENRLAHNMIGLGYHDTEQPAVIRRNMLEKPGWYTAYTPYQAEISQGRLEMLLNFQHLISDMTALPVAGASLLDEATAAAEAMALCRRVNRKVSGNDFLVAADCLPQTIDVLRTRAEPLGLRLHLMPAPQMAEAAADLQAFGALMQYPGADGGIGDLPAITRQLREQNCIVAVACDLLALALLRPPGEWGADIAVGSAQRFGVPLGGGGPHAGYIATCEQYKRSLPGRIIGVTQDSRGNQALRMALQTREQHIRREKATSNICTAQALPANLAAAWAVWHGPQGIRRIAERIHRRAADLCGRLEQMGLQPVHSEFFDTLSYELSASQRRQIITEAADHGINLRPVGVTALALSANENTTSAHVEVLCGIFSRSLRPDSESTAPKEAASARTCRRLPEKLLRQSDFLTHPVFNLYHSETEMMRYLRRLEGRDLSLDRAMIGLGSCTMKLNAAAEMEPLSWPEFAAIHPFAPPEQMRGYARIAAEMEAFICELTGFKAASVQPNAGAQGEFAGLLSIQRYFASRGETDRDICLVPRSAHGTNPASAVMAGMRVVVVDCDEDGNISLDDLRLRLEQCGNGLAALMVTYPSTHGVFEEHIRQVCDLVHEAGGQVYLDGANFNAMMGLVRPADFGADVCHLNLHKTFCIPHGGGGPGVGPIAVAEHLAPWLPGHLSAEGRLFAAGDDEGQQGAGAVSATAWGSAGILPISWAFIRMMGAEGLKRAAQVAMLNANWLAARLQGHYPVLYRGKAGRVAHECVLDLRPVRSSCGVTEEDVAKRLMDYGFHAPTMSFPVAGTLMVEPTESESLAEIDRFCRAMICIRAEIAQIESGEVALQHSPLRCAPHTATDMTEEHWDRPYSRQQAVFPLGDAQAADKYWPAVGRIDNVAGDRNLICTCPLPSEYSDIATDVRAKAS